MFLLAVAWVGGGVLFAAAPASAHAELTSSNPSAGAVLDAPPNRVEMTFTEGVTLIEGGIRLLGKDAKPQPIGPPSVAGSVVTVPILAAVPDASYVLVYRLVSADSHPISGAISFTVGAATGAPDQASAAAVGAGTHTDSLVRALSGVNRWTAWGGIILAVGVPAFVLLCWPAGASDATVRRLTVAGSGLVAVTALAALPLQAGYFTGSTLWQAFTNGSIPDVVDTHYGHAALARACLAVLLPLLLLAAVPGRNRVLVGAAGVTAAGLLITLSWAGHPSVSDYPALTMADDSLHLAAVAIWVGGLAVLAIRLLPAPVAELPGVLRRWSTTAMWAVVVLVVTGSVQAWRELQSVSALVDTTYGRWILGKIAGLAILLALGNLGRRGVRRYVAEREIAAARAGASVGAMLADASPSRLALLRRSVLAEVGVASAVLAATAVLVVTSPAGARETAPAGGAAPAPSASATPAPATTAPPASATGSVELPNKVKVEISVDPPTVGSPVITIRTRSLDGQVLDPVELSATIALPEHGIEAITLTTVRDEAGQYSARGVHLPLPGNWRITVTVRTSNVDSGVGEVTVPLA